MILGFTGTQWGCTPKQLKKLEYFTDILRYEAAFHGDCVGADAQFHELVNPQCRVYIYPGDVECQRADCRGAHWVSKPRPCLTRNRIIVKKSELMIACPKEDEEVLRSGTWSTIRYAHKSCKPLIIIYPDGMPAFFNF